MAVVSSQANSVLLSVPCLSLTSAAITHCHPSGIQSPNLPRVQPAALVTAGTRTQPREQSKRLKRSSVAQGILPECLQLNASCKSKEC
jgi:hypothetical protein